ncbi:CbtB-domain containing protein [Rhodococcus koreensis]
MTTPNMYAADAPKVSILLWGLLLLTAFAAYLLLQENGALLSDSASAYLHEVTHDARHALGMPCH